MLWGLGMTFVQVDEYALALLSWVVASVVLFSKAVHWQGSPSFSTRRRVFIRTVYAIGALLFIPLSVLWIQTKRGNKPWTSLPDLGFSMLFEHPQELSPSELRRRLSAPKSPSEATHNLSTTKKPRQNHATSPSYNSNIPLIFVEGVQIDKKSAEVHLAFKNMSNQPAYKVKETRWIEGGRLGPIWDKSPLGMRLVFIKSFDGLKAGNVAVADVGTLAPGEPYVDIWIDESNKYRTDAQPIVENVGTLTYTDYSGRTSHKVTFCYQVQLAKFFDAPEKSEWFIMKCQQSGSNDSR